MNGIDRTRFLSNQIVNGISEKNLRSGNFGDFIFRDKPKKFLVSDKYASRPDLISVDVYGTDSYWWMIMEYNGICDPFTELVSGSVLDIPSLADLNRYIAKETK